MDSDWHYESEKEFYTQANQVHNCLFLNQFDVYHDNNPNNNNNHYYYYHPDNNNMNNNNNYNKYNKYNNKNVSRTLMIMVDNRPIPQASSIKSSSYFLLNLVINFQYAKYHNYGFLFLRVNSSNLISDVKDDYHQSLSAIELEIRASDLKSEDLNRQGVNLFHPSLSQFRAAPWGKLPVLIYLLKMLQLDQIYSPTLIQYVTKLIFFFFFFSFYSFFFLLLYLLYLYSTNISIYNII